MRHIRLLKPYFIEFVWISLVLALIGSSVYLGSLVYRAYHDYHITMMHPPYPEDPGMNQLEVVYFLGNTIVALIAAFSIIFARSELKHAEESRRASIYMELHKRYNSQQIKYSYRKLASFLLSYDTCKLPNECLSQYTHRMLLEYYREHVIMAQSLSGEETEYSKTIAIIPFFEDIGVLVARKYLHNYDLFDYIGTVIVKSEDVFKDHIKCIRKTKGNSPNIYANALTLMKQARIAQTNRTMHSFNEGEYRITN